MAIIRQQIICCLMIAKWHETLSCNKPERTFLSLYDSLCILCVLSTLLLAVVLLDIELGICYYIRIECFE